MGPLVVLAYSGGLDTSAIVPWLRENYGARVLCFAADVGQGPDELTGLVEKAKRSGAVDCVVQDLREEFVRDFVFPTLRAGAVYARSEERRVGKEGRSRWRGDHEEKRGGGT